MIEGKNFREPNKEPIIEGDGNNVKVGENCNLIELVIEIFGSNNKITIGEFCTLRGKIHIRSNGSTVSIGQRSSSNHFAITVTEGCSVYIGDDCMFSHGISIRTGDGHSIIDLDSGQRINHAQNVSIGNHVWVGEKVTLLKGTVIPKDCIIAASSIISGPLGEANAIYGGVPPRLLKTGITWDRKII